MLKNYLTVALRNFWRNKTFAFINILGLAIGISASLVIYLIVHHEFSYEKFRPDTKRIFRIVTNMHFPDNDFKNSGVPGPLPEAVRKDIPGIEESSVFITSASMRTHNMKVTIPAKSTGNEFKKQSNIIAADNHYFKLFHYHWLCGSVESALAMPNKVVLTESRAKTYFHYADPSELLGQTILYNDSVKTTVSGIVKDLNEVTDFTFKEFISLPTFENDLKKNYGFNEWGAVSSSTQFFLKFQKEIDPTQINNQLRALRKKYTGNKEFLATDHLLQPITDIHFNQEFDNFSQRQGHKPTMYGLLVVAAFLLLLGCINFINLTTAQASQRAKEIGIRKTMGSSRLNLMIQFLSETILLTLIATILSLLLTPVILKIFSEYVPDGVQFQLIRQPNLLIFIITLLFIVSLLAGFYPALILSKYKPVLVLKNLAYANTSSSRRAFVRKSLTVFQFVIAQFFIIATLVVGSQIRFTLNKDLGFRKDAIIYFSAPFNFLNPDGKQFVLQQKLKAIPEIQELSLSGAPPSSDETGIETMEFFKDGKEIKSSLETKSIDTNYLSLYQIKLLVGRNLHQSDTGNEYLVNEAFVRYVGYKNPNDAIGKMIQHGKRNLPIVGVLADFHTKSLHMPINPLGLKSEEKFHHTFHIAFRSGKENAATLKTGISKIAKAWKEIYPDEEFKYNFYDESIANFYKKEQQTASLLNWCTGLSILISCLGLLGLVIYTTAQRTKEIGVRKVLGATVAQIVSLISKDFMQLVILAFIIALPLAWWAMYDWLQDFAYHPPISWGIFLLSGSSMIIVALLTLSVQTVRSATVNPVKSLRTE